MPSGLPAFLYYRKPPQRCFHGSSDAERTTSRSPACTYLNPHNHVRFFFLTVTCVAALQKPSPAILIKGTSESASQDVEPSQLQPRGPINQGANTSRLPFTDLALPGNWTVYPFLESWPLLLKPSTTDYQNKQWAISSFWRQATKCLHLTLHLWFILVRYGSYSRPQEHLFCGML